MTSSVINVIFFNGISVAVELNVKRIEKIQSSDITLVEINVFLRNFISS